MEGAEETKKTKKHTETQDEESGIRERVRKLKPESESESKYINAVQIKRRERVTPVFGTTFNL